MLSAGIIDDIIGGGIDLIGGAVGSAFGDDAPAAGYDKEYGEEARRMRFGQNVGRRIAMGDPTVEAYFKSKMRTDPEKVNQFIDDFGGDFREGDKEFLRPAGMFGSNSTDGPYNPNAGVIGGQGNQDFANAIRGVNEDARGRTSEALDKTLERLSNPSGRGSGSGGYSFGNTQPANIGGFNNGGDKFSNYGKRDEDLSLSKGTPLKVRAVGSGNKYAKMNQERKTGMFA